MTPHKTAARPRVAFQGEPGAFSEEALTGFFKGEAEPLPRRDFRAVVEAVESGEAPFGILPVENTLAGGVGGAWDALADSALEVVGEVIHPIRLFLLGVPGARASELERILSHPVALAQCTRFLASHAHAQAVAVHDTAGAAQEVAREGNPRTAAVAPQGAAQRYGLEILQADLQDRADNQTRFFVVRREGGPRPPEGRVPAPDRLHTGYPRPEGVGGGARRGSAVTFSTVLLVEARDQPGALLRLLVPFATRGIDLSRIESRPGAQPWQYRFVIELRADASDQRTREALDELRSLTAYFRLLGSFRGANRAAHALTAEGGRPAADLTTS